jgi:Tfp pilus assembly protein PilN
MGSRIAEEGEMKLQKWALFRGSMEPATNGHWVLATDVEALEKRIAELEQLAKDLDAKLAQSEEVRMHIEKRRYWLDTIEERPSHKSSFDYHAEGITE